MANLVCLHEVFGVMSAGAAKWLVRRGSLERPVGLPVDLRRRLLAGKSGFEEEKKFLVENSNNKFLFQLL